VPHDRLPVHEGYCPALHRGDGGDGPTDSVLEQQLAEFEQRITEELRDHEEDVERRLLQFEDDLRIG
jgi:hypothetical protein